ncbi:MAG TPA: transcription termination factor Rho, partial [Candidatus Acetothermia bacterium]|nr:transcription termination factor Rho [Candidatus Acetothermia bacterium]
MEVRELQGKTLEELSALADQLELKNSKHADRDDLLRAIMSHVAKANELRFSEGVLELHSDGYGFLRGKTSLPSRTDVYVSPSQIKRLSLRSGDLVTGAIRAPKSDERYFALLRAETVNGVNPDVARRRAYFRDLTPLHPDEHLRLEHDSGEIATRIID